MIYIVLKLSTLIESVNTIEIVQIIDLRTFDSDSDSKPYLEDSDWSQDCLIKESWLPIIFISANTKWILIQYGSLVNLGWIKWWLESSLNDSDSLQKSP